MRTLFALIVIAAAAYLGYTYYQEHLEQKAALGSEIADERRTEPGRSAESHGIAPAFQSKIEIPAGPSGEKRLAPPGTFYMLKRVSAETRTGVRAVVPGEQVKLLKRTGKILKLTDGTIEFEVDESQVTNDLELAREAERKDFEAHPRRR